MHIKLTDPKCNVINLIKITVLRQSLVCFADINNITATTLKSINYVRKYRPV